MRISRTSDDGREPEREPGVDVLVVEDNQINQFVFTQILEALGLTHRIVATGRARESTPARAAPAPRLRRYLAAHMDSL